MSNEIKIKDTLDPQLVKTIEAVIFASETPLSLLQLQTIFPQLLDMQWYDYLAYIERSFANHAIELRCDVLGYYVQLRPEFSRLVGDIWPDRPLKLSQAALEVLSVVAYKQPVTRGDIEFIRGVTTNSQVLRQLFERGWIAESGVRETPGRPALLVTTNIFLHDFRLQSLDELPIMVASSDQGGGTYKSKKHLILP